ncbi:hypothetical protein ACFSF0_19295 [Ottowia flava]|uniref:Uncharacterized protein n=1 Tax=Ottowia flava TaxID=2675430 RepID=A0ABW4KZH5_9BURK|nr:hypothetical protein [Ottowia sp. GY511]
MTAASFETLCLCWRVHELGGGGAARDFEIKVSPRKAKVTGQGAIAMGTRAGIR